MKIILITGIVLFVTFAVSCSNEKGPYQLKDYNDKVYEHNEKDYLEFFNDLKDVINSSESLVDLLPYLNDDFNFDYDAENIYLVIFPEDLTRKREKELNKIDKKIDFNEFKMMVNKINYTKFMMPLTYLFNDAEDNQFQIYLQYNEEKRKYYIYQIVKWPREY